MSGPIQFAASSPPVKEPSDGTRRIGDIWQWLGLSGDLLGTGGTSRRTFWYSYAAAAVIVAVINILNVITDQHDAPHRSILEPVIWEASSWLSLVAFFWIAWIAWRLAPLQTKPRWRLLLHVPAALIFCLVHVSGFVALRSAAYWALGSHYQFGRFWPQFLYESSKDAFGYVMFLAGFALIEHLLRQQQLIQTPGQTLTFDIRDGAKLTRVRLSDILAITSAGNYVEFALADGRRLLMRSPLSALESDLEGRGFVRTHRSWLVNESAVTGLTPEGSGDYGVVLGDLKAPLSRRFPAALARLRTGTTA
jgi:hypothetical protein